MAAHAASPTCCPVPSHNELVRPCFCHREQMSAGQRGPAFPGLAPAARCEVLLEPLLGASCCSGEFACISSGLIALFCFHPPFSAVLQPLLTALCRIFALLAAFYPFLLFSVLPGVLMISPRSCPSARYPVGPQHSALCTPSLALSRNSCQAISISKAVPDCLLTYSRTALRF